MKWTQVRQVGHNIAISLGRIELVNGAIFDPVMPHALKITQ